ncbi:MAG: glycerate kinase, partial [Oscillospiraceae bacterium]
MKKCIIVPDSFKGTLSSIEICNILERKVLEYYPQCQVVALPVADGGEGTVDCFMMAQDDGQRIELEVSGPFPGEKVPGFYGRFGDVAVVEMAAAAGLPLVKGRKFPEKTTTFGVGELIRHAVEHGAKQVILGLGGSSTNDGGCGCAAALGVRFTDASGQSFVPVGATLHDIAGIDVAPAKALLAGVQITAMCDVEAPLYGPSGAAAVFGPQKGADAAMVQRLEEELICLDKAIQAHLGLKVATQPGAGAAGGFGAGVLAFLGGELRSGIETVLDIVHFDDQLADADLVFTGEGRIDRQSLDGKVVIGVARRALLRQVPVVAIVGDVGEGAESAYACGVSAIFSTNRVALPYSEASMRSRQDLQDTADNILR